MKLHIFKDADAAAQAAADFIADRISTGNAKVLGLATGKTPIGIYDLLRQKVAAGQLSFSDVTAFNLDEYLGISADNPASFAAFMQQRLFDHVPFLAHHIPDGTAADPNAEALAYEARIKAAGGIDLQLLGIGRNGHIGFNEPGAAFDSVTRVVDLSESTRIANASDFPDGQQVPQQALTMGIASIMNARQILLVATGEAKAEALRAAFRDSASPDCPASALQAHEDAVVFADKAAAEKLSSD